MTTDLRTSLLINRQVPEFIREEYPLFISFLEAYYEYLETKQGSQINDLTTQAKELKYIADVDVSINKFEEQFFNTFANLLPRDVSVNKEFLIKNVLPLYLAKGNEKAFKLLFRMLYNDEVDIILPKSNVLRASDGKWVVDNILKIETDIRSVYTGDGTTKTFYLSPCRCPLTGNSLFISGTLYVDGVEVTSGFHIRQESKKLVFDTAPANGAFIQYFYQNIDITMLDNRQIRGRSSGATAIIERSVRRIITDELNLGFPFQLFINSKTLNGSFLQGEEVETDTIINGNLVTLRADTFSIVNRINVISGGSSYNVGDPVLVVGGGATEPATGIVSDIVEGYIDTITVNYGGAGFSNGTDIIVSGIAPLFIDLAVDDIDTSGTANSTQNTYSVFTDRISDYGNVSISASDYGFPGNVIPTGENVSTVIADALTPLELTDLGPMTNVIVLFSNTSVTISPSLDAVGAVYEIGNNFFSIRSFESVGRIQINDGGQGYVEGDEVVFGANPYGTFGQGAAAAVKAVNANGTITQIEIQPSRISGTANISSGNVEIIGTATDFGNDVRVGDRIIINNESRYINAISNTTHANVNVSFTSTATGRKIGRYGVFPIGGQRYDQNNLPTITISSSNVSATGANVEITSLMGDGENITPFIGNVQPGEIITIDVVSGGANYQYIPQVDLTGYGDGTATANADIESVYVSFPGRWTTSDSIISSSERKLQGRDYYVDYSYVTSSLTEFSKYKNVLKDLLHPAGFVNYADLNKANTFTRPITVETSSDVTISGTVNVANASIYVTGTNTYFNIANTNAVLTIGSNIVVNNEIRVVDSIISNTNLSVTSAFTTTANVKTLTILT